MIFILLLSFFKRVKIKKILDYSFVAEITLYYLHSLMLMLMIFSQSFLKSKYFKFTKRKDD